MGSNTAKYIFWNSCGKEKIKVLVLHCRVERAPHVNKSHISAEWCVVLVSDVDCYCIASGSLRHLGMGIENRFLFRTGAESTNSLETLASLLNDSVYRFRLLIT